MAIFFLASFGYSYLTLKAKKKAKPAPADDKAAAPPAASEKTDLLAGEKWAQSR